MPARLSLNLFSPLPPLHSEIGNHTLTVANALSASADVTLWTPQAEPPTLTRADGARLDLPVVQFDPARMDWARLNQADAQVYNIGNNASFHRAIFDVARQAPGLVVLHDTRLQHFFARYAEQPGPDRNYYLDCLLRTHGAASVEEARRWLAGEQGLDPLVEQFPMTLAAVDVALAVIVHNREEQQNLAALTRTPVFHLPLAYPATISSRREAPVSSEGGTLRLVVFGFLGPNRRLGPIVDVIAALPDQDVRLDIYGALDEPAAVTAHIEQLRLNGRVALHGFVPEAELRTALERADLAINLRFPSMGEASASQLRIWDAALPSVVTRTGWYATLPEDAVFFVDPDREADTLTAHLTALRQDPARFRQAGLRGRFILRQHHTPSIYATGLLEVVGQMDALHARRHALELSRKAARTALEMTDEAGVSFLAEGVARAITALTQGASMQRP